MQAEAEILEDFREAVWETWVRDGKATWPVDINSVTPLFMDIFVEELLGDIDRLRRRGFDDGEISRMFKAPARIFRIILPALQGMKRLRFPMERQRECVIFLLSLIAHLKHGDLLNRDSRNLILSPSELSRALDEVTLLPADRESAVRVQRLCGVLWAYSESVCFRAHGISKEFHGPYSSPEVEGDIVVRDYFCLRASELWPECADVPYGSVRVVTVYAGVHLAVDLFNHFSLDEAEDFVSSARYHAVVADGAALDEQQIGELCVTLSRVMRSLVKRIDAMGWRELAHKYAEIFWFGLKGLREELELDWRPPATVRERIAESEQVTSYRDLSQTELRRLLRLAF